MTRNFAVLALLSISSLLFGQETWQGEVKKMYPIDVPSFEGAKPVFAQSKKTEKLPDIEIYTITTKLGNLKTSAAHFQQSLEKQGFKPVKTMSTPTLERVTMLNASRKLTAVVVASKKDVRQMIVGVTVLPEGTLPSK